MAVRCGFTLGWEERKRWGGHVSTPHGGKDLLGSTYFFSSDHHARFVFSMRLNLDATLDPVLRRYGDETIRMNQVYETARICVPEW